MMEHKMIKNIRMINTIVFTVLLFLKVAQIVDWSWWWIMLPVWGPLAVAVIVIMLLLLIDCYNKK
jgi:hypothetical protein